MTDRLLDPTQPGKAGLFADCSDLTEAGWAQEHEARARLTISCAFCGDCRTAGNGHGVKNGDPGIITCASADCLRQGEAWAAERDRAEASLAASPGAAPRPSAEPVLDLFGVAA